MTPRASDLEAWRRHLGGGDLTSLRERLAEGTLPGWFAESARRRPDAPALDIDGVAVTHGELDDRVARVAGWLRARGVRSGDRVALCAPTSMDLIVAYVGALRAGATVVLCDAALTVEELEVILGDAEPVAAFASPEAMERIGRVRAVRMSTNVVIGGTQAGVPALSDTLDADPAAPEPAPGPALLAYTSGTTGRPKGVPLTHGNVLASIRGAMLAWRWSEDDVLVHTLPLSHQHGLSGVHASLIACSQAIVSSQFDPAWLCDTIRERRGTVLFAVPSIYERLDRWDGIDPAHFASLRLATSGSAPLPAALAERVVAWLGGPPLERYGSTEGGIDLSNFYDGPRRIGKVGWPAPGVEVDIVDPDGRSLPAGQDGEIVVRGPQVFAGYWRQPEATAEALTPDGWFRTGDLGNADPEDGCVTITGRLKELIITGGLNVYPREVEAVLERHPSVRLAAVAGVASERWGEEVTAFVVPASEVVPDDLIAHCRQQLSAYKCPKRVITVPELPVNRMGKVRRTALAELIREPSS